MAIVPVMLQLRSPALRLEAGSYASSETRLDFGASILGAHEIVDESGRSFAEVAWSLRLFDASGSVKAEVGPYDPGSIKFRPPSPNQPDAAGDCVVQADLSPSAFAGLLAACLAGRLPGHVRLEVEGLEEIGEGRFRWDRALRPSLAVTAFSLAPVGLVAAAEGLS